MRFILGLDPGKSGAWALYNLTTNSVRVGAFNPKNEYLELHSLIDTIKKELECYSRNDFLVVIEKVHSMPKQGVKSMFSFGTSYGILIGFCQALVLPHVFVPPQIWKREILMGTLKDKEASVAYSKRMYPELVKLFEASRRPHDGIADAVCIMSWGRFFYGKATSL